MHKKVLLIDDDEDEQFFFTEALKEINAPIKFFFAATAKEGIRLLNFFTPDIVFIDINMPALNGFECLEMIQNDSKTHQIPAVIYSTGVSKSVCDKALKKGAVGCIKKQGNIHELADAIKNYL